MVNNTMVNRLHGGNTLQDVKKKQLDRLLIVIRSPMVNALHTTMGSMD
jgi:hypothetical protein